MNNNTTEIYFNLADDDYDAILTRLLENDDDCTNQNLTIDTIEKEKIDKISGWLHSELLNFNNSESNSASNNTEQTIEKPANSLINPSVSNEQYLAMASNNLIAMITPDVDRSIYLKHPILNIFRIYSGNDFIREQIRGIPKLKDCVENTRLYFSPVSAFVNSQIECTLVFKGPDGEFYFGPYGFVRSVDIGFKIENRTVFDLNKDAIINNEFVSLEMTICKLKNSMFESNDKQQITTCQIKRALCDTIIKVDHKLLLSWGIYDKKKKMNKNAKHVTPTKLAKYLKLYTAYLIIRRTHWHADEKRFVPEQDILFCSNAFTPVDSSHHQDRYDYSPNKLQITQLRFSLISSHENINQYYLQVSFIIPELYRCTELKNKYLEVKILTSSEEESKIHPNYKFMNGQRPIDSKLIPIHEYDSTMMFNITKRTVEDWETDFILHQSLPISSSNSSTLRTVTIDNSSMNCFRIQLQLCHCSNDDFVPYPRSIIVSDPVIDEVTSEEIDTSLSLENDNLTDDSLDQLSTQVKRSFEKEPHERTGSPMLKTQKHA
ncbi:unnamed protein product [Rotaria sordida]|uniref:Uncharacterized protein n=1 Tax=Rotaria sordida TaxID=392033 RepID=A0A814G2R2_9BILA|nr:unnamed protein product [Rotaria sordida]